MAVTIVNGRIDGLRITIYDIVHYLERGRSAERIAEILPLTLEQVQAAIRYIEEHKAEVMEVHRRIEERIARGNPPEIEAKLEQSRLKMEAWIRERRRVQNQNTEVNGEGHPGGRE
jgi:uncharacterized protein (DUF433 family)